MKSRNPLQLIVLCLCVLLALLFGAFPARLHEDIEDEATLLEQAFDDHLAPGEEPDNDDGGWGEDDFDDDDDDDYTYDDYDDDLDEDDL